LAGADLAQLEIIRGLIFILIPKDIGFPGRFQGYSRKKGGKRLRLLRRD